MARGTGALLVAALAFGCGGTERNVEPASRRAEPMRPGDGANVPGKPAHLTIAPMTITAGDDAVYLRADGSLEARGRDDKLAIIRPTGEVLHPNRGLLLTLNVDGTITSNHAQLAHLTGLVIQPDGAVLQNGERILEVADDGAVLQNGAEVARIEGPVEGRRAAMLVLMMVSSAGRPGAPPPSDAPAEGEPPPPDSAPGEVP